MSEKKDDARVCPECKGSGMALLEDGLTSICNVCNGTSNLPPKPSPVEGKPESVSQNSSKEVSVSRKPENETQGKTESGEVDVSEMLNTLWRFAWHAGKAGIGSDQEGDLRIDCPTRKKNVVLANQIIKSILSDREQSAVRKFVDKFYDGKFINTVNLHSAIDEIIKTNQPKEVL